MNHLEAIIDFIYNGQVDVAHADLEEFLKVAVDLKVKGLDYQEDKSTEKKEKLQEIKEPKEKKQKFNQTDEDIKLIDPGDFLQNESCLGESEEILEMQANANNLDEKANELMEKTTDSDNKTCWNCTVCGKGHNDKTRIRKHIKSSHLRKKKLKVETIEDKVVEDISFSENMNESLLDENSFEAETLMEKLYDSDGRNCWTCLVCDKKHNDKYRIRKHIQSKHKVIEDNNEEEKLYSVTFNDDNELKSTMSDFNMKLSCMMNKAQNSDAKVSWSCQKCGKTSNDKTRIKNHVECHIEKLLFTCLSCNVKKTHSNGIRYHVRLHTQPSIE